MANLRRAEIRTAIHTRIRRKVRGTTERPRLAVYRSLNHIYAQLIDDDQARTIASASTTEKSLGLKTGGNIEAAKKIGQAIAERALAAGVETVVFDRGGYLYHGRVKALTDAAVTGPKFPSIAPGDVFHWPDAPLERTCWRLLTTAPVEPSRRVGMGAPLGSAAQVCGLRPAPC